MTKDLIHFLKKVISYGSYIIWVMIWVSYDEYDMTIPKNDKMNHQIHQGILLEMLGLEKMNQTFRHLLWIFCCELMPHWLCFIFHSINHMFIICLSLCAEKMQERDYFLLVNMFHEGLLVWILVFLYLCWIEVIYQPQVRLRS